MLWTNVYGVARTVLAIGTAATLAFNPSSTLFVWRGAVAATNCSGLTAFGPFCLAPTDWLDVARWLAVGALFLVASGWHPRWTGLIHWWVSWGFYWSAQGISDAGDKITAIIALFLIPITLTDPRRWHWQNLRRNSDSREYSRLVFLASLLLIRVQVAVVYLEAVLGKMGVPVWRNGTALYYILQDPTFGAPRWLMPIVKVLLMSPFSVSLFTWGTLVVESFLFFGFLLPSRYRSFLLVVGIVLHLTMGLVMGVLSFGVAMAGALILYLRSPERVFRLRFKHTRRLRTIEA
jgi:sporulation delaying protein B